MKGNFTPHQEAEAIERLRILKLDPALFCRKHEAIVCRSPAEIPRPLAASERRIVCAFEHIYHMPVYLIVHARTRFGMMDALLYIGSDEFEWVAARSDLMSGYAYSYVVNHTVPELSEFQSIGLRPTPLGGIVRTF